MWIGDIPLSNTTNNATYRGWSIARLPLEEDEEALAQANGGKKPKPFNLSGRMSTLPELHLALKKIYTSRRTIGTVSVSQALKGARDAHGRFDVSDKGQEVFTNKVFKVSTHYFY